MSESDVKIYVSKKELNKGADLAGVFDSVIVHRVNGNIDKAKALGIPVISEDELKALG